MTRKTRTIVYSVGAFIALTVLILLTAWQQGVNPFHPRTRHIWALSLVAALYAAIRGSVYVERWQHRKEMEKLDTTPASRHSTNIKDRMRSAATHFKR